MIADGKESWWLTHVFTPRINLDRGSIIIIHLNQEQRLQGGFFISFNQKLMLNLILKYRNLKKKKKIKSLFSQQLEIQFTLLVKF